MPGSWKSSGATRFTHELVDELKSWVSAPEASAPDVHDSKHHGYRYSGYACSSEICTSCYQPKFFAFFPSLLLQVIHQTNMKGPPRVRPFFRVNLQQLVAELRLSRMVLFYPRPLCTQPSALRLSSHTRLSWLLSGEQKGRLLRRLPW